MTKACVLLMFGAVRIASGFENPVKTVQVETTERAKIAPGGLIRLVNSSGDLIVEAWDRQEVEVTVTKWIDHEFKPEQLPRAEERLKLTNVHINSSTDAVTISTVSVRSGDLLRKVVMKSHIYAPRDSRLAIDHRGGYILISGFTGDIDVADRRGDIVLMLPDPSSYTIDARNKFGIVTPDVAGIINHKYLIGEQFSASHEPPTHHMRLRMGFGGITIKETRD